MTQYQRKFWVDLTEANRVCINSYYVPMFLNKDSNGGHYGGILHKEDNIPEGHYLASFMEYYYSD